MLTVSVQEFSRHLSKYFKIVKAGGIILLTEDNKPIATIAPHNPHLKYPTRKLKTT